MLDLLKFDFDKEPKSPYGWYIQQIEPVIINYFHTPYGIFYTETTEYDNILGDGNVISTDNLLNFNVNFTE